VQSFIGAVPGFRAGGPRRFAHRAGPYSRHNPFSIWIPDSRRVARASATAT
jgi:hypothetical protein